jgi:hypothetical protein
MRKIEEENLWLRKISLKREENELSIENVIIIYNIA